MKRTISLIILGGVICVSLFGCQKNHIPQTAKVDHSYKSTEITLPNENNVSYQSLYITEGADNLGLAAIGFKTLEYGNQPIITRYDISGEIQETSVITLSDESYVPYVYTMTNDGVFYYLVINDCTSVMRYQDGENEIIFEDVSTLYGDESYGNIQYISVDEERNIYIATESEVIVFTENNDTVTRIECNGTITDLLNSKLGTVYVQYNTDTGNAKLGNVDLLGKQIKDISISGLPSNIGIEFYVEDDMTYYIDNGDYLYYYSAAASENDNLSVSPLCNWINSDIIHNHIRDIAVLNKDTFVALYKDTVANDVKIIRMDKLAEEQIPEKYLIKVAALNVSEELTTAIVNYNRNNDEYRVVIQDYSKFNTTDNLEAGETALQRDLVSDKIPDVFLLSDFMGRADYLQQNMFVDLYDLMRADAEFTEDMLLSCVLQPFEKEGRLFELVSRFTLKTVMANDTVLEETWDLSSFVSYAGNLSADNYLLANTSPERTLRTILSVGISDFVDADKAVCSFDSELFKQILELSKNIGTYNYWTTDEGKNYRSSKNIAYNEGRIKLYETEIGSLFDYVSALFMFHFNDVNTIGYPYSNGNGVIVEPVVSWAISNQTSVREGAWGFIKSMLTVSSHSNSRESNFYLAALKDLFIEENTGNKGIGSSFLFEFDGSITSIEANEEYNKDRGIVYTISQNDVDSFMRLLERTVSKPIYADKILEIIIEDASAYFSDAKSLQETVEIIQNRCSIYISEILG